MDKFLAFMLWLCGILWLSQALPIVGTVWHRDPLLGALFIAPGIALFLGDALLLSLLSLPQVRPK